MAKCPICLDDAADDDCDVVCCGACSAPFHRFCAKNTLLAAVEQGGPLRLPVRCPLHSCSAEWPDGLIVWALDERQLTLYRTACAAAQELLSSAARGGSGSDCPDSPRTVEALLKLGVRSCPQCCSLIQKQAEGLLTGCDKMTCRCGCMFCFSCLTEARSGGVSRCRCVGTHHMFIPHSKVLGNYARQVRILLSLHNALIFGFVFSS